MTERMQFIDQRTGESPITGLSLLMNQRPEFRPDDRDIELAHSSEALPNLFVLASTPRVRIFSLLLTVSGAAMAATVLDTTDAHAATANCDFEVRFPNSQVRDTVQIRNADNLNEVLASAVIEKTPGQVLPVKGGPSNATVTDPRGNVHDGKRIVQTSNQRPNPGPAAVVACGNWIEGNGPLPGRSEAPTIAPTINRPENTPTPRVILPVAAPATATALPTPGALQVCPEAGVLNRLQDSVNRLQTDISDKDQEIMRLRTQIALTSPTIWRDLVIGGGALALGIALGLLGREGAVRNRTRALAEERNNARHERDDMRRDLRRAEGQRDTLQAQLDTANNNLDPLHIGGTVNVLTGERNTAQADLLTANTALTTRTGELTARTGERDDARRAAHDVLIAARTQVPAALTAANIGTLAGARTAVRNAVTTIRTTLPWPRP